MPPLRTSQGTATEDVASVRGTSLRTRIRGWEDREGRCRRRGRGHGRGDRVGSADVAARDGRGGRHCRRGRGEGGRTGAVAAEEAAEDVAFADATRAAVVGVAAAADEAARGERAQRMAASSFGI